MSLNQRIESIITRKLEQQQSIDIISQSQHSSQKPISQCVDKLFKLIVKLKQSKSRAQKEFPTQIRQRIFIGNYVHSGDEGFLLQKNVGLVISCMDISPLKIFPNIKYQKISIKDRQGQNLLINAQKIYNVIENYLSQQPNANIFIHCFHGKSRSVAVLLIYLMKKQKRGFEQLYNQLRGKYHVARVNSWFVQQLKEYEKQIGLKQNNQQQSSQKNINSYTKNDDLLSGSHHEDNNHDLLGFSNPTQPLHMMPQQSLLNISQSLTIDPKQHLLIPESQKLTSPQKKKQQYHLIEIQQDEDNNQRHNNVQNVQLI